MSNCKYVKMQSITQSESEYCSIEEQYIKKNLLLAKWAHELKNIFIVISSLIQNQNDFNMCSDRQDNKSLKQTQISSQQSSKFLSNLCDFGMYLIFDITTINCSNATIKERQPRITEFNISEALDFCIAMFQSKQKFDPKKRHILIRTQYQFPIDTTIKSINEKKFKQIVINLLSNSYKFTLNGEICLSCYFTSQDILRIQISDTGIGMTPDEQEKLFVPYSIIEKNKDINAHGSGLGLFIVKEILASFGSEIHMQSEKNGGSQFWFDLKESRDSNDMQPTLNDKNVIDPTMLITDSLKNLIIDINEGKKDQLMKEFNLFNNEFSIEDKSKIDTFYHSNYDDDLESNTLNKSESKCFEKQQNSLSFNRKADINTQSSSKIVTENGEFKKMLTQKKLLESHHESLGDYCRSLSQYPQHLRNHQQFFSKKAKKLNIFVCDDEPITALATKNLLSKYFKTDSSYSVAPDLALMSNGIECLYKAYQFISENNPVNIILIDQNMPFLNGIEVCNIMKGMKEMNSIKIYLVTSEEDRLKNNVKADGFFSKPLTKDNVREILDKERIQ